ncbi:MAG: hypothetical protein U0Q16_12215 [Bryobacteraceae bacterium]
MTPHTYFYDVSLLLPAILMLVWNAPSSTARWIAIAALLPLPWAAGGFSLSLAFMPAVMMTLLFLALTGYLPPAGREPEAIPAQT